MPLADSAPVKLATSGPLTFGLGTMRESSAGPDTCAKTTMDSKEGVPQDNPVRWRFANAEYNERIHELKVNGESVQLEPKPLEVLLCLLRAEGELVTRQELFETVWPSRVVTDGVLVQAIRRVREVLGDEDRSMLRTVHGYGYRIDVPIEILGHDDPGTRLDLEAGSALPGATNWILDQRLQTRPANELWRIRHRQSGEFRVVKLALNERAKRSLKREVTLNKVLRAELGQDAPLVPLLEWQFDTKLAWIQMPWYEHGSLADWLAAQGGVQALPMPRRCRIAAEAAESLAKAHALGVMHKDIKPGNLLVDKAGDEPRLLLCDFGSGTIRSRDRLEQAGVTIMGFTQTVQSETSTSGTPAYMAPEVLKGGVFSEKSDVYAVGILLYQLVTGDLNQAMAADWEEDVQDPGLREIIAAACAGKPSRRIADMAALAHMIRRWEADSGQDRPGVGQRPTPDARPDRRLAVTLLAILMLSVAGLLALQLRSPVATPQQAAAPALLAQDRTDARDRVAILAFELLGLDESTRTVMAGLQDALIADLAKLPDVRLVHGQNIAALGLQGASAQRIGEQLNAEKLIRGSVQQAGEALRVNLQIVDTRNGETLWGRALQGDRSELFSVQENIASTLAKALGSTHLAAESQGPTTSNAAYEAYLTALNLWKQGLSNAEDSRQFDDLLTLALRLDPAFVDAHLLALLKAARDYWFSAASREASEALIARHLGALEQLETRPVKLATARAVRRYYLDHDPASGVDILAPFRKSLLQNHESALFYAYMLRRIGRPAEAIEILDQIADLDPSTMVPISTKAELLAHQGRGAEALQILQAAARRMPGHEHSASKSAMYGYLLTGDLRFAELGIAAAGDSTKATAIRQMFDLEIALRAGDFKKIRQIARDLAGEDEIGSGHGKTPHELRVALALYVGQAPPAEIGQEAAGALQKLLDWRRESDSAARRGATSIALALLGQESEAIALSLAVEEAFPLSRDQLEGADRLREALIVRAILGDEAGVLQRLQTLLDSPFVSLSACSIANGFELAAVRRIPAVQAKLQTRCEPIWARNRKEMQPYLIEMQQTYADSQPNKA